MDFTLGAEAPFPPFVLSCSLVATLHLVTFKNLVKVQVTYLSDHP